MTEWTDPRCEDLVETMHRAQDTWQSSPQESVALRGFVVAEPDEA
ncbi:hypothetical protein [Streptomyces sp. NPDC002587]